MGNVKRKQVRAENGKMGSLHAMLAKYPDERSCEQLKREVFLPQPIPTKPPKRPRGRPRKHPILQL